MSLKVSIVICTYNRAAFLRRTLYSLKRLNYKNFEVIVVNGPSDDCTDEVIEQFKTSIKVARNDLKNLSVSRNIGIQYAAGDIVAFIDDDAIPDEYWLDDIVELYMSDSSIGGVGGKVYGPGNNHFQFENGWVDLWGNSNGHDVGANYNDPNGLRYNMMLGTNCTFRKDVLMEVNGFDEFYDYFHDESDLCLRVVRAGYKIVNHKRAYIHHEYAKSHIRENTFDGYHLNWFPIIKNKIYFALKNSYQKRDDFERYEAIKKIKKDLLTNFLDWKRNNFITSNEYEKYIKICEEAYEIGKTAAEYRCLNNTFNYGKIFEHNSDFKVFDASVCDRIISVGFVCKDNPELELGGIAKYTHELGLGLVKAGHFTGVSNQDDWITDWMNEGICYHKVKNYDLDLKTIDPNLFRVTYETLKYSYDVYKTVNEVRDVYEIDIIETPLWNFEGLVVAYLYKKVLPVVTRVETPLLKVAETEKWEINDDLRLFSEFEKTLLNESFKIISISDNISQTISNLYDFQFNNQNTRKIYLGVEEFNSEDAKIDNKKFIILTVGRLERRKGIHTIFKAIPEVLSKFDNVEFHFVGDVTIKDEELNTSFKDFFDSKYSKTKWYNRVKFLGSVSKSEKYEEYQKCKFVIAPSLYESFGLMAVEAASCSKPTIGSRIGGMQEVIEDGKTGFLIDVEDYKGLRENIEKLIENKKLLIQMGENAFNRYKCNFTQEIMVNASIDFYFDVVKDFKRLNMKINDV